MRFVLLNPNTNAATTGMMVEIGREALAGRAALDGMTAAAGEPVITDEAALATGAAEVGRMAGVVAEDGIAGVLVAAFGDPGLEAARALLAVPVTGLAEAAVGEAGRVGRFSIVTTTPALDGAIRDRVARYGAAASFAGVRYTRSGTAAMADPARLHDELLEACALSVRQDGVAAIVIGGGPLAAAARALRPLVRAALVEPIPAAMRAMLARAQSEPEELSWPTR